MTPPLLARRLAEYAYHYPQEDLPSSTISLAKLRVLDSLACIVGAYDAPPVNKALMIATTVPVNAATLFGTRQQTTPDMAAFVNGIMVRYLDYNDGYMGKEPGHPSDNIPACLAVAEAYHCSGLALLSAIILAYDIQIRLQDAARLNSKGWDHVNFVNVSAAAACGKLMGLTAEEIEQAINLSLSGHIAMRQVRVGTLSDWKGCSAANATRNAVFCAQLAGVGMTGPAPVFEGDMGFYQQISGNFELPLPTPSALQENDFAIHRSLTKTFPTNGELHTAIWAALTLREQLHANGEIARIVIETSAFNVRVLADKNKWHPTTRETADHSLPYNVAVALLDGEISAQSYASEMLQRADILALMTVTEVVECEQLTALFPARLANRITVHFRTGETLTCEQLSGPGSVEQPMTRHHFENKFRQCASAFLPCAAQDAVLSFVDSLEQQHTYTALFDALVPSTNS